MIVRRILFICWANCVRSQMAEALLNYRGAGRFEALSAGVDPAGFVHGMAEEVLRESRVPTRGLASKSWEEVADRGLDAVVTLCDFARDELEKDWPPPGDGALPFRVHWGLEDPVSQTAGAGRVLTGGERLDLFRAARDRVRSCVERLVIAPSDVLDRDGAFGDLLLEIGGDGCHV